MKVSDAITHLEQLPCDDTIALAIWTIQDVHCMEQGLNNEEARKVLDYVHDNQDALTGINWDSLSEGIDYHSHNNW